MFRRVLAVIVLAALALFLLVAGWPQLLGLQRQQLVAQLVSFRSIALAVAAGLAVALIVIALASKRARRFCAAAAALLLAFSGVSLAVSATRGWGGSAVKKSGDLTVLSWNTLGDAPGAAEIAKLALSTDADIVSLPETSAATAEQVAVLMRDGGRPMWVHNRFFDQIAKARTTSLLISADLGRYRLDTSAGSTRIIPSGVFRPIDGTGPTIVAAHPVAPVPGEMPAWRQGLAWLAARCAEPNVIMAGDFNSTLDHYDGLGTSGVLGGCRDGARQTGAAAVGSWPTDLPPVLGTPIDHVMATSDWTFTGFEVITTEDSAGSDHRPVLAHLHHTG